MTLVVHAGGGAVVNVVTKLGTNAFHGAAWEFVRNNAFDARNFFLKPNQQIAALHQNQFGVAGGGPIIKNRTFFFGDFDLARIPQGQFATGNVQPMRSGLAICRHSLRNSSTRLMVNSSLAT